MIVCGPKGRVVKYLIRQPIQTTQIRAKLKEITPPPSPIFTSTELPLNDKFLRGYYMIRHTVLFKIKEGIPKEEIENVFTQIVNLGSQLPGILSITGGTCYFQNKEKKSLFTHGFSIDFQDEKARSSFLNDPVTYSVKENILNITNEGTQGVMSFDFGEWG